MAAVKCRATAPSGTGLRCALKKGHRGTHWGPWKKVDLGYSTLTVRAGFCHRLSERCNHAS